MKKTSLLSAAILGFCACNLLAAQISLTWDGGPYGQWETATNWDPQIIPENNGTDTFAVIIGGATVELAANHSIDSLDTYGSVSLKRWTLNPVVLTVSSSFTNHGELDTPNTTHLHIYGALINDVNAHIDILSEELSVYSSAGIQNRGSIYIDPDAELESEESDINNTGVLRMRGGVASAEQTLTNNIEGMIEGYGLAAGQQIVNAGMIESIGGTLQLHGETFSNTGTLKSGPGASIRVRMDDSGQENRGLITASSDSSIVYDCNFANEPNGVIKLLGGTFAATTIVQKADATFEGFGGIMGNVQIDPNATVKLTGPTNLVGDVNIPSGATLEISDGQTLITGHTTCNGIIRLKGGTVVFQGGCDCSNCNIIHDAGTDRNLFDVNTDGIVNFKDFAVFVDNWLWNASWYTPQ